MKLIEINATPNYSDAEFSSTFIKYFINPLHIISVCQIDGVTELRLPNQTLYCSETPELLLWSNDLI